MKWFKRRRGGRIPPPIDMEESIPVLLSEGAVCCTVGNCDWVKEGGSEDEMIRALAQHALKCHFVRT